MPGTGQGYGHSEVRREAQEGTAVCPRPSQAGEQRTPAGPIGGEPSSRHERANKTTPQPNQARDHRSMRQIARMGGREARKGRNAPDPKQPTNQVPSWREGGATWNQGTGCRAWAGHECRDVGWARVQRAGGRARGQDVGWARMRDRRLSTA